ncbi:MAG: carboxypeptidase-like regulatory domain-containing protein [Candidatus Udaeobacter sp.]
MLAKSLVLSFVGSLFVAVTVWAGTSVEGVVKDSSERPVKGADIRIEAKNFSKVVKTDGNGHYICDGLAVGTYKVTLLVNGQVKASILDGKTQAGKATQFNFKLTGKMASAKKRIHIVWVPPDLSTHIGRWVEVDENGNVVNNTGFSNIETTRGTGQKVDVVPRTGAH